MIDDVTLTANFPEKGGVHVARDHSAKVFLEVSAEEFAAVTKLQAFPDFAVMEVRFVLKEIGGRAVRRRVKKGDAS